jgi:predicted membrane-bound mannosyltransferase
MAVSTERSEDNSDFARTLPRPVFFTWATWVLVCALAYWTYFQTAGPRVSVVLSLGFWTLALVVIPIVVRRGKEPIASVVAATLTLLGYVLLMQDALR